MSATQCPVRLVVGSNFEQFWLVPRRGDVGVARSTSRSRNDGSGQKCRNYEYKLTARDTGRDVSALRARGVDTIKAAGLAAQTLLPQTTFFLR